MSDRYVCLSDLNNYFKKSDLLKGLTESEKLKLRTNIGVVTYGGDGSQPSPIQVTYNELYDLILNSTLIVGARYMITDFQTIYTSNINSGETWGSIINPSPIYNLIVIANNNSQLDPRAFILEHPDWIIEYDVTRKILLDGRTTKGKITYMKDKNGNSAYYDFKSVKFRRTQSELSQSAIYITSTYIDLYTFSDVTGNIASDVSEIETTKYNVLEEDCWNNVFVGDTYNNVIKSGSKNNSFLKGGHDNNILWESCNNFFNESVCYLSGSLYNIHTSIGWTTLSTSITKSVLKVNESTILSFLDPITYSHQVILL